MEYVALGDTVRFGITIHHPSGSISNLVNSDETPRWFVYTTTSGDNPLMQGAFTARSNLIGTYQSNFACTGGNNFVTGDYVEVHASGKVNGVQGRAIIKTFVIDDVYLARLNAPVSVSGTVSSYLTSPVSVSGAVEAYLTSPVSVSGQVSAYLSSPVSVSGAVQAYLTSPVSVSGQVSAYLTNPVSVSGVVNANLVSINGSGVIEESIIDVNVVRVSGTDVHYNDIVNQNVYFANIKFIKDSVTPRDEYTIQWFKNAVPLASGGVTNAAISVYRADGTNTALLTNQQLAYTHISHGGLRYNETSNLAVSGEAYVVVTSGTIDASTRTWQNVVGLDYL
jgi:hypothetical protein